MDTNADDQEPDNPPSVSPRELEEALKWLEELTARPGAAADGVTPPVGVEESPFHGLIEGEENELPDWLRETPSAAALAAGVEEGEFESRLDWLAKMAERESIEELPTLEWRRLSDPMQEAVLTSLGSSPSLDPDLLMPPERAGEDIDLPPVAETAAEAVAVESLLPAAIESESEPDSSLAPEIELAAIEITVEETATPPTAAEEADLVSAEHLIDTLPPDEELPPIDDLDAAMAWIEELAASQDAPIEDVPSVADRALASKLMMEAGLTPDTLDLTQRGELSFGDLSLLEGSTPVNPFVEAEDFADTIMLIETISAEQGTTLPGEAVPPIDDTAVFPDQPTVVGDPSPDDPFREAMAFLDDLAAAQQPSAVENEATPGGLDEPVDAPMDDLAPVISALTIAELAIQESDEDAAVEMLAPEEAPWRQEAALAEEVIIIDSLIVTELASEGASVDAEEDRLTIAADLPGDADTLPPPSYEQLEETQAMDESPQQISTTAFGARLEEKLRALDALALPAGRTLADIDDSLQQTGGYPVRRDLPAALTWLETALRDITARPATALTEDELIARMPEDPDAVLAWLEQMAGETSAAESAPPLAAAASATGDYADASPQWAEADLLNMPDDPDEAMLWLERLAAAPPPAPEAAAVIPPAPAVDAPPSAPPAEASRPRRRRGRRGQGQAAAPAATLADAPDEAVPQAAEPAAVADAVAEFAQAVAAGEQIVPVVDESPAEAVTAIDEAAPEDVTPAPARPRRRTRRQPVAPAAVEASAAEPLAEASLSPEAAVVEEPPRVEEPPATEAPPAAEEPLAVEEWPTPAIEEAPSPPAKPKTWVDLLKPLK